MPTAKFSPFDSSKYLVDDETIAIYLRSILEENDPGLLADALGQIAKARGMTEIAAASGMTRESLYKALRADAQPRFATLASVLSALGLKFSIEPVQSRPVAKRTSRSPAKKSAARKSTTKGQRTAAHA